MNTEANDLTHFQDNLNYFFNEAVDLNLTNLKQCGFWIRTMNHQERAAEIRQRRLDKGLPAPPMMVCSITNRCNLNCKGCYAMIQEKKEQHEISADRFDRLFGEAAEIGTNIVLLAGGEPLLRRDILESATRHKETVFPVFTNGTLLNKDTIRLFKKHRNLIPVLSIEGDRHRTDERRGAGLYDTVESTSRMLRRSKIFYGLSITLTRENYREVTGPAYLRKLHDQGCRLFFFVEYVPATSQDRMKCILPEQKEMLPGILQELRGQVPALYVSLPGEEEQYGGCLAAGRGFVHISASGDIEACPFAPYSDSNIIDMPFTDALDSVLLNRIRDHHHLLKESEGGCALWENRAWVEEQLMKEDSLRA